jgi:hypothetical protein
MISAVAMPLHADRGDSEVGMPELALEYETSGTWNSFMRHFDSPIRRPARHRIMISARRWAQSAHRSSSRSLADRLQAIKFEISLQQLHCAQRFPRPASILR